MIPADISDKIKSGAKVRVWEKIPADKEAAHAVKGKEEKARKEARRVSKFEGLVLGRKHGNESGGSFTVRATVAGVGVEKVYPIHSPMIEKVEIINSPNKVSRSKLYYLRSRSKKETRQKLGAE